MTLFELQKFGNRLHTAMAGQIAAHGGVFESVVKSWEDEFETYRPFVTRVDTGTQLHLIPNNKIYRLY